jgi:nitrate reductase gamma subunit
MTPRFLYQAAPYLAVVSLLAGLWIRYAWQQRRADGNALRDWTPGDLGRWECLLCVGLLILLMGHLAGIVVPQKVLYWNSVAFRLYVLEAAAFGAGLLALAGWIGLGWNRVRRPARTVKEDLADELFIMLLLVALLTGSFTSVIYRWGSSWGVSTLSPYMRSLLGRKPLVELVAEMPFLVRLHVFSAFLVPLFFPFTRPAQILLLVLEGGVRRVRHPVAVRLEQVRQALRLMVERHNPAAWLWPEED